MPVFFWLLIALKTFQEVGYQIGMSYVCAQQFLSNQDCTFFSLLHRSKLSIFE